MNDIQTEVGKINTTPTTLIERSKVDYENLAEQIDKAHAHIDHDESIIANAQQAIAQARQNIREQRAFITISRRRQKVMRRATHALENINMGL